MEKDFKEFKNQLSDEIREFMEELNIDSFDKLMAACALAGIDVKKLEAYNEEHGDDTMPSLEDVRFDDGHPMRLFSDKFMRSIGISDNDESSTYDDYDDDPFLFPENCFIDEPSREYHIRIKLNNAPVPIWRELKLPSNLTLETFAFVVLAAMGWDNSHLHAFRAKGMYYKNTACIKQDRELAGIFGIQNVDDTNDFAISYLLKEVKDRIKFEYDFGDSWEHDIWLKGIRDYEENESPVLKVIKGTGQCPPEDCGGVWGYEDLLEIVRKRKRTEEERERIKWYGMTRYYDPNLFDIELAQKYLDDIWNEATGK